MKQFSNRKSHRGFTLIELLIVIAILGILSVAVVTALNVVGNLNKGTLARAKTFNASIENALSINQVGKWSFEDGAGSTSFKDISGYNNNGSCSGTSCPTWKTAIDCGLGYGGCLSFDGDDEVDLPESNIFDFGTGDFTISAWINSNPGSHRFIYGKGKDGNTDWEIGFYIDPDNKLIVQFEGGGGLNLGSGKVVGDGKWHHGVLTRISGSVRLYVDGKEDGIGTSNADLTTSGSEWIGQSGHSVSPFRFVGMIDEVAIYKQALGAYQIQHLYAQGFLKHLLAGI